MKYISFTRLLFGVIALGSIALSQVPADTIAGPDLRAWLKSNWYNGKHTSLGYSGARAVMYAYIDNKGGHLECVYSGYERTWDYGNTGTNPDPVNCEHTIPQSWFDEEATKRSDIFHLYPTYNLWNTRRGSLPFADIDPADVDEWHINSTTLTTEPTSNQAAYSKWDNNVAYEPRDEHKGNVARSAFYFYSMYPEVDGGISRLGNLETFYRWHTMDPVDSIESTRNEMIEQYQGNRNPYIDHPEWVARAWGLSSPNIPSPPDSLKATAEEDVSAFIVSLVWRQSSGTEAYDLYRISAGDGNIRFVRTLAPADTFATDTVTSEGTYFYFVRAVNHYGESERSELVQVDLFTIGVGGNIPLPETYLVLELYPNPFNPTLEVNFSSIPGNKVSIDIFDINGRIVTTLYRGIDQKGGNSIRWNAGNLSGGLYLIRLSDESGAFLVRKALLLK